MKLIFSFIVITNDKLRNILYSALSIKTFVSTFERYTQDENLNKYTSRTDWKIYSKCIRWNTTVLVLKKLSSFSIHMCLFEVDSCKVTNKSIGPVLLLFFHLLLRNCMYCIVYAIINKFDMSLPTMWYVWPAKPQISLIRGFASRLNMLWVFSYWLNIIWSF